MSTIYPTTGFSASTTSFAVFAEKPNIDALRLLYEDDPVVQALLDYIEDQDAKPLVTGYTPAYTPVFPTTAAPITTWTSSSTSWGYAQKPDGTWEVNIR